MELGTPGLSPSPSDLALFGADELLHDFVHAFQRLLFVLRGPRFVAAHRGHQRCGAIGDDIADPRMRYEHAIVAGQRRWSEFAPDAEVNGDGTIAKPDPFAANLPPSHALAWLQVGQDLVVWHEPVIAGVVTRRLPIDAQRLVRQGRERAACGLIG